LLPEQTKTHRQLAELWPETPFVLIGANALALQIELEWRQTNDLDLVVSIALKDYPAGLAALPGWQRRREGEHAWLSPSGVKVDVVPAGPGLLEAGSLTWPESDHRMNLVGLRLAFDHHVRFAIDERHTVRVATTVVIVVLKMVAFLDRPGREDDLTDIAQVLERYLGPTDARRWALSVDFDNASAFALGIDVGDLVNEREQRAVTEFLARAKDEDDRTHALFIRNGLWFWREHPEALFDRLAAFEKGMLFRSSARRRSSSLSSYSDWRICTLSMAACGTSWPASASFSKTTSNFSWTRRLPRERTSPCSPCGRLDLPGQSSGLDSPPSRCWRRCHEANEDRESGGCVAGTATARRRGHRLLSA
jgi:predicted nucleotidyltransferase